MIDKSLSTSQKFARLHGGGPLGGSGLGDFCQTLFMLLVSHADDFGRLQGDPFTVKHQVHPSAPRSLDEFAQALCQLEEVNLIDWYERDGHQFIQIVEFEKHQGGLHKRTRSRFPAPPGTSRKVPETPAQLKRRELNLTKENRTQEDPDLRASDARSKGRRKEANPKALRALLFDVIHAASTADLSDPHATTNLCEELKCRAARAGLDYAYDGWQHRLEIEIGRELERRGGEGSEATG